MKRNSHSTRPLAIMAVSSNPISPECLSVSRGIQAVCVERGWVLHLPSIEALAPVVKEWRPDAIILVLNDAKGIRPGVLRGRVVVSAGENLTARGWPSVVPDDAEIGRQAARHLLGRGLRSLAAFGIWHDPAGKATDSWAARRVEGFAEVAHAAGIAVRRMGDDWIDPASGLTGHSSFSPPHMLRWLEDLPKPVGILAGCDAWGPHLSILCRELKLRIPEDVAIVGAGDERTICEIVNPPLSSVTIPWERLGRSAAELAGSAIAGRRLPMQAMVVPPAGVTVRRSSDMLAIDDPDVAAALAMIIAHRDKPLKVSQILRKVPATQSRLERHFKKLIGRSMVEEIRRVHIEQAKRLLGGSDLDISEIASRCGYTTTTGMGIAFREETGTTPSKFRRRFRQRV